MEEKILIEAKNLKKYFKVGASSQLHAVDGVNFKIKRGTTLGVVGESGCGKSVTAKSIMRLIKTPPAEIKEGSEIIFDGEDVLQFNEKRLCAYRGGEVAMVFQDALAALNPTMTVGNQIIENLRHHTKLSKKEAKARAVELLRMVGIPQPESRVDQYPHEFSGGQRQRISIARALIRDPKVIVLDEATSALDSISEKLIQQALNNLTEGRTTFIVAHRLSTIRDADRIAVIADGRCAEYGTYEELMALQGEFYQLKQIQS